MAYYFSKTVDLPLQPAVDKTGTMLPCNVVIQEIDGRTEVAAVDPLASMQAIPNKSLATIAAKVGDELKAAVEAI